MTSTVSLEATPPLDPANLDAFTRVFALGLMPPRPPGSKTLVELQDRGFRLGRRFRAALKAHDYNAFDPRQAFQELYAWRISNIGAETRVNVVTVNEPITDAEMIERVMIDGQYPAFYADWLRILRTQPELLRHHGSIVALGSTLNAPADPEYHGEPIDHVPYAVFEPLLAQAGVLSTCAVTTPFPAGTGFLTIDLR